MNKHTDSQVSPQTIIEMHFAAPSNAHRRHRMLNSVAVISRLQHDPNIKARVQDASMEDGIEERAAVLAGTLMVAALSTDPGHGFASINGATISMTDVGVMEVGHEDWYAAVDLRKMISQQGRPMCPDDDSESIMNFASQRADLFIDWFTSIATGQNLDMDFGDDLTGDIFKVYRSE